MSDDRRDAAIAEERRRLHQLRTLVDLTRNLLVQERMTRAEAETLVARTRRQALALFPDGASTFDLVLAPRFRRLMDEFVGPPQAKVLSFERRRRPGGSRPESA
jgi:hypothetical protein